MENEENKAPEEPNVQLGVDEDHQEPEVSEVSETPDEKTKEESGLSQEELEALQQKAAYWELIEEDPELFQKVAEYFQLKATGQSPPVDRDSGQEAKEKDSPKVSEELKPLAEENQALREQLASIQQALAAVQIQQFAAQHPDLELYRADMARLMREIPNLPLDKAYQLAKAQNPQPQDNGKVVKTPTSEVPRSQPRDEESVKESLAKEASRLLDRKKYPDIQSAFDEAVRMSMKLNQGDE